MAGNIRTAAALREYTEGVAERAAHHAPDVDAIWPCLLGYAMVFAKAPVDFQARRSRDGTTWANQAWVEIKGRWINFTYRRKPRCRVEVCEGLDVLASFDNDSSPRDLLKFFQSL